jgi:uncharacterized membrane protein HdeD (DUF308 family)
MTVSDMKSIATATWWLLLVRGVLAVLFGLYALLSPGSALATLVFVFGFYAIIDGVSSVMLGIRNRKVRPHWGWQIADGVISVGAGIVALTLPGITTLALLFVLGVWAVAGGVVQIVQAISMRTQETSWGWLLAAGIAGVAFGVILFLQPAATLVTLIFVLGIFLVAFGVAVIVWAVRARSEARVLLDGR